MASIMECIVGIDPGATGAIAVRFHGKSKVYKMPKDIKRVDDLLKHYQEISDSMLVVLEQIRLHRMDDLAIANRMQKLYGHYSELKTLLIMNGIPYAEASPKAWQSFLGLNIKPIRKLPKDKRKKAYRDSIQQWWPEKLPIVVADAVCLLVYGERNLKYNPDFGIVNEIKNLI